MAFTLRLLPKASFPLPSFSTNQQKIQKPIFSVYFAIQSASNTAPTEKEIREGRKDQPGEEEFSQKLWDCKTSTSSDRDEEGRERADGSAHKLISPGGFKLI
ncbi:hypothetical protein OWV82_005190 [Melia azedarach]|uniref:Uncharacterized protein n=1 Tax=Melia azedarach TaxID=155640 RepID=A0ACC1YSR5_MELAZ|nr:hypothetical protein OWV82_005190 [Melia azedarach]